MIHGQLSLGCRSGPHCRPDWERDLVLRRKCKFGKKLNRWPTCQRSFQNSNDYTQATLVGVCCEHSAHRWPGWFASVLAFRMSNTHRKPSQLEPRSWLVAAHRTVTRTAAIGLRKE